MMDTVIGFRSVNCASRIWVSEEKGGIIDIKSFGGEYFFSGNAMIYSIIGEILSIDGYNFSGDEYIFFGDEEKIRITGVKAMR